MKRTDEGTFLGQLKKLPNQVLYKGDFLIEFNLVFYQFGLQLSSVWHTLTL